MNRAQLFRVWMLGVAGATVLTAVTVAQWYAARQTNPLTSDWQRVVPAQAFVWYEWAVLAPLIVFVASMIPWTRGRERPLIALWIGLGAAFATGRALIDTTIIWVIEMVLAWRLRITPTFLSFGSIFSGRVVATLLTGMLIVGVVVLSYYAVDHYRLARVREERQSALEKARARAAKKEAARLRSRLPVHIDRVVRFVDVATIDWIEVDGKTVRIHQGRAHIVTRQSLAEMTELLGAADFIRVHRSALVNVQAIQEVQPWFHGDYMLLLRNGAKVPTGRSYRDAVRSLISVER